MLEKCLSTKIFRVLAFSLTRLPAYRLTESLTDLPLLTYLLTCFLTYLLANLLTGLLTCLLAIPGIFN